MKKLVLLILISLPMVGFSQGRRGKVVYKYKKYEKFDFADMVIEGDMGSPGDLSITPRYQRKFKNPLPIRWDFRPQIRKAIERIR
ncbi:MAG: hypothetical protein DRQ88_07605 [Epsilonproteobacteria bacterium]|nr:MAG: hypothetical protein DRQ89_03340 [Campylobacterota bacterium]RLA66189.1 MAG: hypothetical protein DRQ88_07605 [Campylobacterota bacterium]